MGSLLSPSWKPPTYGEVIARDLKMERQTVALIALIHKVFSPKVEVPPKESA
ncbi:MAG: hypothetical protein LC793_21180 [Thermomicrobia bacterium]|nr:hypothetical protein [Thermomicrobia bacterium]